MESSTHLKNILRNMDGDCHLCTGKLTEITVGCNIVRNKRILCLNCKATADGHSYGHAYIIFGEFEK